MREHGDQTAQPESWPGGAPVPVTPYTGDLRYEDSLFACRAGHLQTPRRRLAVLKAEALRQPRAISLLEGGDNHAKSSRSYVL